MKVAIIGANGALGSDACRVFEAAGHDVLPLTHQDVEVADAGSLDDVLRRQRHDLVLNTAAMHNLSECEAHPERAFAVNGLGARNLALAARELGFVLMHISTDYVFDGAKQAPYVESDCPRPINVYGNSKMAGERFVEAIAPRHFLVRTSGLYGVNPVRAKHGLNFVLLMLKLAREHGRARVVTNEVVSPTYTLHLARQLLALCETANYGLYHASSGGECTWFEFAKAIFEQCGLKEVDLQPAVPEDLPGKVPRPAYSVLGNERLGRQKMDVMPHWREALTSYLEEIRAIPCE